MKSPADLSYRNISLAILERVGVSIQKSQNGFVAIKRVGLNPGMIAGPWPTEKEAIYWGLRALGGRVCYVEQAFPV
jgi:hypothetical protein